MTPDIDDFNDDNTDRFHDLAEKIQIGSSEEGAQALRELVQGVQADRASVVQVLHQEAMTARVKKENAETFARVLKEYPELKENDLKATAAAHQLRKEVINDLKNVPDVSDEILSRAATANADTLMYAHGIARLHGAKVRTSDELADDTVRVLKKEVGLRHAGPRPAADVIREMRSERGRPAIDDGASSRSQQIAHEARTARAAPAYQPRRVVQPATAEAAREERSRAYVQARVNRHAATRGFAKPL